jgi:squalene-associated FAD-dependent desaturase
VLFGCYRHTYQFLRRIGAESRAPLAESLRLSFAARDGAQFDLECPRLPPPWHLVAGLMRWKALTARDRLAALRLRGVLAAVARNGAEAVAARVPPDQTVSLWLASQRQTPALTEWLWQPLAFAALNQSPDVAAAQPFVRVLGELFGATPEASAVGLPEVPLDELYATPAAAFIEGRHGRVICKAPAKLIVGPNNTVTAVHAGQETIATSAVISTVPWYAFGSLWTGDPPESLMPIAANAARMKSSPIVTVNLWLDAPIEVGRFVGLIGGPMHWLFNKSAIYGDDTAHLSVVASGADELADMENRQVTSVAWTYLQEALPDLKTRELRRSVVVREHRATFSLAPDSPARPPARTDLRGFYLAGDWTDTGLPGTIEGAVQSGHVAAERLLADWPIITA